MKKILMLLLLFLLSFPLLAEVKTFKITVHYVNNESFIPLNVGYNYPRYKGASYIENGHCHVYVIKPNDVFDFHRMEIFGHEVLHCTDGDYHK